MWVMGSAKKSTNSLMSLIGTSPFTVALFKFIFFRTKDILEGSMRFSSKFITCSLKYSLKSLELIASNSFLVEA